MPVKRKITHAKYPNIPQKTFDRWYDLADQARDAGRKADEAYLAQNGTEYTDWLKIVFSCANKMHKIACKCDAYLNIITIMQTAVFWEDDGAYSHKINTMLGRIVSPNKTKPEKNYHKKVTTTTIEE